MLHRCASLSSLSFLLSLALAAPPRAGAQPLNPSFEQGLTGWTKTGTAFDAQPTRSDGVRASRVKPVSLGGDYWSDLTYPIGVRGRHWVGTAERRPGRASPKSEDPNDAATGTLTSAKFKLPAGATHLSFLIGGGDDKKRLKLELLEAAASGPAALPGIAVMTGHGSELLRRDWWSVAALDRKKDYVLRITDLATGPLGHLNVDDFRIERAAPDASRAVLRTKLNGRAVFVDYDAPVWGASDLHTHLMSHLSMGRKIMHGAPDVGSILPAGTHNCNARDQRAASVAQALGNCNSTHGGWGLDNRCGNHLRALLINVAFDSGFVHKSKMLPTDGACPAGTEDVAGLCYTKCRSGYHGAVTMCQKPCPAGFRDDGLTCWKPSPQGRGSGYSWDPFNTVSSDGRVRCERDHGKGRCEENTPSIWYPKCKDGYQGVSFLCHAKCPAGFSDHGGFCGKARYDRGVGKPKPHPLGVNLHGDHPHAGYPKFLHWPHHSSVTHQQMYVDWLRRAHQGGLRMIVALAVNNHLLGEMVEGDEPKDDKGTADLQVDEIKKLVARHADFMTLVLTPADLRRALHEGKLAVIAGIEVDNLGNFNYRNVTANERTVRAEIRRLHAKGVRYIFPVHFADNKFGGVAVYEDVTNLASRFARSRPAPFGAPIPPGLGYDVEASKDPRVTYRLGFLGNTAMPRGTSMLSMGLIRAALDIVEKIPFPPAFDLFKCPTMMLGCLPQVKLLKNLLGTPDPLFEQYARIKSGHANKKGLLPLGKVAINEMMKLGMIIDIDHMSEKMANEVLTIAKGLRLPVVSGHNGRRADGRAGHGEHKVNENSRTDEQLSTLDELGSILGVGWADGTSADFLSSYRRAMEGRTRMGFTLGSDINGFESMPKPRPKRAPEGTPRAIKSRWSSRVCYARPTRLAPTSDMKGHCTHNAPLRPHEFAEKVWSYNQDGVAHIGLYPDIYQDLKNLGMSVAERERFFGAADSFARLWDQIEARRGAVR